MPDLTLRTGQDTFVLEAEPANSNNAQSRFLKIRSGDELIPLFYMPVNATRLAGKTITSAILSVPVEDNWVTQTVTIQALDADWKVARVNYGNKPGVTGPTANSGATGVLVPGDRFEIDVIALVQNIADGDPNYGWRLTTSQTTAASQIRGFDSGYSSFTLTVEFVDQPDAPTQLSPEGIIGLAKPVVTVDNYNTLAEMQVQVDATPSGTTPDYDTGWVATTRPKLDLSDTFPLGETVGVGDTTYNGQANNAVTNWRSRVKLLNGGISGWSPWAEITRKDKPTIVDDTGTTIYDPSPIFEAHLSPAGDTETRWQVIISEVADPSDVRYNSGDAIEGAALDLDVPLRNAKGKLVFPDDGTYRREIRAWDRTDRVPSAGDRTYVSLVDTITLNADGALDEPTLTVTLVEDADGYPQPRLHIEALAEPEWFVVRRDGEFLTRFDAPEFETATLEWEWDDETAAPNVEHSYSVRSGTTVSGERRDSPNSTVETITATVTGVWLRSDFGNVLLYDDNGPPEVSRVPKIQSFVMPYRGEDVDIIGAIGNYAGAYVGVVDRRHDIPATLAILDQLVDAPTTEIQMVWATFNMWVNLPGLSYQPHQKSMLPSAPKYAVNVPVIRQIDPRD